MDNFDETNDELNACDINIPLFTFNKEKHMAKVVSCYDGDTIKCVFKHDGKYQKFKVRMYGYDSPERRPSRKIPEEERIIIKKNARKARNRLMELILNKIVIIECMKFDKYGRLLAIVYLNNENINQVMINEGHGKEYYGGKK